MLKRRIFVVPLVGKRQRTVERLFEAARKVGIRCFLSSFVLDALPDSLLFHDALQRMLMFAGKVHDLRHLGLSHLVGKDAAFADAVVMHMQHDLVAASWSLLKNRSSTCTTNSIGV